MAVAAATSTVSAELLFTDGDSVIIPLIVRSLALGQPQDWAMSPVLFLPETVVYGMLSLLGLGLQGTLVLNAVVNVLALYGALRIASGRRAPHRAPVAGALLALAVFAGLTLLEGPAVRDGAQFGTLLTTTSYYSATVVATVAAVGLVRRALDGARRIGPHAAWLGGISGVSVLSNPLFAAWAILPVVVVLTALAVARRIPPRLAAVLAGASVAGGLVGYAARSLFAGTIVAQNGNYLRFGDVQRSLDAYGDVVARTVSTLGGAVWLAVVAALWLMSVVLLRRAWRTGELSVVAVAAVAVVGPLLTTAGAFTVGADAARYLQPWMFLPLTALALVPQARPWAVPARIRRVLLIAGWAVAGVAGALAAPAAVAAASRADPDLECVVRWVDESGRTGAGQFWTVRGAKARLDDPRNLVQVDHTLRVYTWLTNRTDADGAQVTFLVSDAQTVPFALPAGFSLAQAETVACGRYTVLDFAPRVLPLGPPRD